MHLRSAVLKLLAAISVVPPGLASIYYVTQGLRPGL